MTNFRGLASGIVAGVASAALVAATAPAVSAHDGERQPAATAERHGTVSLAQVLAQDSGFDRNSKDFDILEAAVLAVLDAKPDSPVGLLTQGRVKLTAFAPTDLAFRRLVQSVAGTKPKTEKATFEAAASLGIDTIESVLLYHVVPNRTLNSPKVLKSRGKRLKTAQGKRIRVIVGKKGVRLVDLDRNAKNPKVTVLDINRGNRQVAHGINRVLRPLDL